MKYKLYEVPTYIRDYSRKRQSDYVQDGFMVLNPCILHFLQKEDERGEFVKIYLSTRSDWGFIIKKTDFDKIFEVEKLESEE